jgi:hypothetical protein
MHCANSGKVSQRKVLLKPLDRSCVGGDRRAVRMKEVTMLMTFRMYGYLGTRDYKLQAEWQGEVKCLH